MSEITEAMIAAGVAAYRSQLKDLSAQSRDDLPGIACTIYRVMTDRRLCHADRVYEALLDIPFDETKFVNPAYSRNALVWGVFQAMVEARDHSIPSPPPPPQREVTFSAGNCRSFRFTQQHRVLLDVTASMLVGIALGFIIAILHLRGILG